MVLCHSDMGIPIPKTPNDMGIPCNPNPNPNPNR